MKVLLHPGAKIVNTVPAPPREVGRGRGEEGGEEEGEERRKGRREREGGSSRNEGFAPPGRKNSQNGARATER
jgi:hypothetical protein